MAPGICNLLATLSSFPPHRRDTPELRSTIDVAVYDEGRKMADLWKCTLRLCDIIGVSRWLQ